MKLDDKIDENLHRLLNHTYDIIFILDAEQKHVAVYGKWLESNEMHENDFLGKTYVEILGPEASTVHQDANLKALQGEKVIYEWQLVDENGEITYYQTSLSPIFGDSGEVVGIIGVGHNITNFKCLEKKLKESETMLRNSLERQNFLKYLFLHDMKNIISVMQMSLQAKLYEIDQNVFLETLETQVQRGIRLIQNIDKLSQIQNNETDQKLVNLVELLERSIKYIINSFNVKQITINKEFGTYHPTVRGNEILIDVFENLIINAIKHNKHQNIEITIRLTQTSEPGDGRKPFWKLEFIDNAKGIPDEFKKSIFLKDRKSSGKGMGIGLSLVYAAIKIFNGKILVKNKVPDDYTKGSIFVVLLPKIENTD